MRSLRLEAIPLMATAALLAALAPPPVGLPLPLPVPEAAVAPVLAAAGALLFHRVAARFGDGPWSTNAATLLSSLALVGSAVPLGPALLLFAGYAGFDAGLRGRSDRAIGLGSAALACLVVLDRRYLLASALLTLWILVASLLRARRSTEPLRRRCLVLVAGALPVALDLWLRTPPMTQLPWSLGWLAAVPWLPLALLGVGMALRRPGREASAAGVVFGLAGLGAWPGIALSGLPLAALGLARTVSYLRNRPGLTGPRGAGALLGVGLAPSLVQVWARWQATAGAAGGSKGLAIPALICLLFVAAATSLLYPGRASPSGRRQAMALCALSAVATALLTVLWHGAPRIS